MSNAIAGRVYLLRGTRWTQRKHDAIFLYDHGWSYCAVCGGLGWPWQGWFSCEECTAISVIATGETFVEARH